MKQHRFSAFLLLIPLLVSLILPAQAAADVSFVLGDVSGSPGGIVSVPLTIECAVPVTTVGLRTLTYDASRLTFLGFDEYGQPVSDSFIGSIGMDDEKGVITLGYLSASSLSGTVCSLRFSVREDAPAGTAAVSMEPKVLVGAQEVSSAMRAGSVTVQPSEALPFTDVPPDAPYADAVRYVYAHGLFRGTSDTAFEPETPMTRAMFVTVLGRYAGVPSAKYTAVRFEDVRAGEWYSAYVEWAAEYQIVNGYGDGFFGVDDEITVEQAAAILARYAGTRGIAASAEPSLNRYADGALVSDWAQPAMQWALDTGIYVPADTFLHPDQPASRALVASMMAAFARLHI